MITDEVQGPHATQRKPAPRGQRIHQLHAAELAKKEALDRFGLKIGAKQTRGFVNKRGGLGYSATTEKKNTGGLNEEQLDQVTDSDETLHEQVQTLLKKVDSQEKGLANLALAVTDLQRAVYVLLKQVGKTPAEFRISFPLDKVETAK